SKKIRPLPKEVVDRIAAGEVVQRPVSVVKELLENSLDADGTQIDIQCQKGGLESITITDNGTGISPTSLPLACTRFATSKLVTVDDLKSIRTFGFRGEALASASMVGRVCISKTLQNNNCAFKMHYRDGNPTSDPKLPTNKNSTATIKPKPSAGKEGTTITVQDLFYNIPSRRRAMEGRRSERDEYDRILNCVQRYAVHEAKRGVGFVCRGGGGGGGGKGAAGRATTKDVIGHIFGTAVSRELLPLNAGEGDVEAVTTGLITNGSYSAPKSSAAFLLFINDRLVESASLRRAVESIYSDALPKGGKPFVYLSLELPGPHVDVNVHPTKREVAFLHEDRLCVALAAAVKEVIGSATSSRTFAVAASGALLAPEEKRVRVQPKKAIAMGEREGLVVSTASNVTTEIGESDSGAVDDAMAVDEPEPQQIVDNTNQQQDQQQNEQPKKRHADESKQPPLSKKPYDPSRLVRTNSAAPAAPNAIVVRINANNNIVRPKKISPTECDYESIAKLRGDIVSRNHQNLNETLRGASFVGAVSRSRSLIQYGIDLLMINHRELARETFYQIALMKFNGMPIATLGGGGVDSDATHESLRVKVNKTNATLAKQATSCLSEKADMLEEYFSIKFERRGKSLFVTGLPVLLEGHSPQPHALPLFLMRLATEVNWMDERLCFQNVCTELGSYYSEPPVANDEEENAATEAPDYIDDEAKAFVKHTLFPAISFLLVPPKEFATNGTVLKLANLTSLYKVFERC
ncbi:mlh1-like protein, partial [Thalassiosira pseudonana CCMP1335]